MSEAASPFFYDEGAATLAVDFFREVLTHVKGEKAGQPFELAEWQATQIIRPLFGWKRKADNTRRYRQVYVEIPRKNGKLLALDSPIPTPTGWTMQGDLRPGDQVFDHLGHPTGVVAVSDIEEPVTYRIRFSDDTEILAGAEHEWYTDAAVTGRPRGPSVGRRLGWTDHIRTTEQIADTLIIGRDRRRARTAWNHRIPLAGPLALPEAALPIPPYALGLWLGDGSRGSSTVTKKMPEDAAILMARARAEGVVVTGGTTGRWSFRGFAPRLRALGVLEVKAIPAVYLRGSLSQRFALVAGLMDTDGFCSPAGQCEFSSTAPGLRDGMLELLRSLGYKPTCKTVRARYAGRDYGEAYRIQFWAYVGAPVFTLPRKAARLKPRPRRPTRARTRQIVGADVVPTVPMRCIEIEHPLGLYLAGRGMVPTHNSSLGAGLGLYLLCADGEQGAEIYSAASDREQAAIVFDVAKQMRAQNPELRKRLKPFRRSLVYHATASSYKVLSADAETKHGVNAHGIIFDELHAQPNRKLYDVLTTSTGSRQQPVTVFLTTAGYDRHSICWEVHEYAEKVRDGIIDDPSFLPVIYSAGKEDPWDDPAVWATVNPGLGASVKLEYLEEQAVKARASLAYQNTFRRLHLNQWTEQSNRAVDMGDWDKGAAPIDWDSLAGRPCFAGLDLASTSDIAALVLVFPDPPGVLVVARYWVPEDNVQARGQRDRVPYADWIQQGYIAATPGNQIDYDVIRRDINALAEQVDIQEIAYDRWGATQLATQLTGDGLTMVPFGQGFASMAAPTKELLSLILAGRLAHGGDPVLRWMASNLALAQDAAGNLKPDKARSGEKIDGVVSLVMALDRASRHPEASGALISVMG